MDQSQSENQYFCGEPAVDFFFVPATEWNEEKTYWLCAHHYDIHCRIQKQNEEYFQTSRISE